MRFHKDEIRAPIEVRECIVAEVLRPRLATFESELGFGLPTEVIVCAGPEEERVGIVGSSTAALGTARLRLRPTFRSDRFLFRVEAVFRLRHPSGFSGFYLSGDVIQSPAGINLRQTGFTVQYNNHEWQGWI